MQRPIAILAILTTILIAAYAVFASAVPTAVVGPRFLAAIERGTGMRVESHGRIGFTVFPRPRIAVAATLLRGADGAASLPIGDVEAGLELMPLLSGEIVLTDVQLTGPSLDFLADGSSALPLTRVIERLMAGRVASIAVRGGSVTVGARRDAAELLRNADFSFARSGNAGIRVSGNADWRGERIALDLTLGDVAGMTAGNRHPARLDLVSPGLTVRMDGQAALGSAANFDGAVSIAVPEPAALAVRFDWAAEGLPAGVPFSVKGRGQVTPVHMAVGEAEFAFGPASALGALAVHWAQPRIVAQGTLAFDELKLSLSAPEWRPVGVLSEEPVVLPGFLANPVDLDLRLSAAALRYADTRLGRLAGSFISREGRISFDLGEAHALDGTFTGQIRITPKDAGLELKAKLQASGVAAKALAASFPALNGLSGRIRADGTLQAIGRTYGDWVSSATGKATVSGRDLALSAGLVEALFADGADGQGGNPPAAALSVPAASAKLGLKGQRVTISDIRFGDAAAVDDADLSLDFAAGLYRIKGTVLLPAPEVENGGERAPFAWEGTLPALALPGWWQAR